MSLYSKAALIAECERYRAEAETLRETLTVVCEKVDDVLEVLVSTKEQGRISEGVYYELFRLVASIKYEGR